MVAKKYSMILGGCLTAVAALSAFSSNAYAEELRTFNVPAGEASRAVPEFARQAGIQIFAPSASLRGVRLQGVRGERDVRDALRALLANSGVEIASDDGTTVTLREHRAASSGFLKVSAQEVQVAQADPAQPVQSAQAQQLEEIVVTGTRVVRDGYEAPTPLTVMSTEDIQRMAPTNIADFVNKIPQFSNSVRPTGRGTLGLGNGNAGANLLNLRSLGQSTNRTLVLLDGMRVVSSNLTQQVDINTLPDALVSRVDIVTGGASAAYGSDAVAGVVNFVLDKDFVGVKGNIQGGVTTYGDHRQWVLSLTGGTPFAGDRGHLLISAEAAHNDEVDAAHREWNRQGWQVLFNPNYTSTNGQPYFITRNHAGPSLFSYGGIVIDGPLRGVEFGPGGVPHQFNYGSLDDGYAMAGGDWQTNDPSMEANLAGRLSRQNLFVRASFDVTDNIEVFAQFQYANTDAISKGFAAYDIGSQPITIDNPFIHPTVLAQMMATGTTSIPVSTLFADIGIVSSNNRRQQQQYTVGASGRFDAFETGWAWDIAFQRGISRLTTRTFNNVSYSRFYMATDAVRHPTTGVTVCRSTITNPTNGCVPWNSMGIGVNSQAAIDYLEAGGGYLHQKLVEDVVAGKVAGEPFSTWAGPVSVAFGVEHRKESVGGRAGALDEANDWAYGNFHASFGKYTVNEGFAETVVPLAKDAGWAELLEINGAVRVTDYSTSGKVVTWKAGLTYEPIPDVRIRATRSRDIRAPNLAELFTAGITGNDNIRDPTNGRVLATSLVRIGNPDLDPEEADTTGLGIVYRPSWFEGFSASFDYFKIDMTGAVSTLSAQQVVDFCYTTRPEFCQFIVRNAAGNISTVYRKPANFAFLITQGFDIEASYNLPLDSLVESWKGSLTARGLATHTWELTTQLPNGQAVNGAGVNGGGNFNPGLIVPKWRWTATLSYDADPIATSFTARGVSAGVQDSRFIECTSGCPAATSLRRTIDINRLAGQTYFDFSASYKLEPSDGFSAELFLTVENLANADPVIVPGLGIDTLAGYPATTDTYDQLGRIFRAGVRFRM